MIVSRTINNINFDVEISDGNTIFFNPEDISSIGENINDMNTILNYIYMQKETYIPLFMTIELTKSCNYKCPFCFINTKSDISSTSKQTRFEDIKSDLKWLIDNGLMYCIITGGEALMHPDFVDLYSFLKENGVIVTVFSNLSLLNEELLSLFKKYPPFRLETTIYGYNNENYFTVTKQKSFSAEDLKKKIVELKANGINIIAKTPINKLTISDFDDIRKWCLEHEIPYYFSEKVFETYDGTSMSKYDLPIETKNYILSERMLNEDKKSLYSFGKKTGFSCGAGKFGFFISHDYKLRPCMSFYDISEANFKILPNSISASFNVMLDFIEQYKNKPLSKCNGCHAYPICKVCIIDEIKHLTSNHYDYESICNNNIHIHKFLISNK